MTPPLYEDFNYTITRESLETRREFIETKDGKVYAGWEMLVPPPGPDGVPYQLIFVGPASDHRGCAVRMCLVDGRGNPIEDDAEVTLETYYHTGSERTVMFQGRYGDFKQIADQWASEGADRWRNGLDSTPNFEELCFPSIQLNYNLSTRLEAN